MKKASLLLSVTCVAALAMAGCGGETESKSDGGSTSAVGSSSEATSEASFEDGVLELPALRIKITDSRVIQVGEEGNEYGDKPVIAFWYETTNLTDDDISPLAWIRYFDAFQDNNPNAVNQIEVASLPDSRFLDSQTETIKKDGTVENAMAYSLDDETTPVELVASENMFTDSELGRMTFTLD